MSRHRNIRSMNISDEYDGYDDVYGHSVEEDYCISPSDAAQFIYDREGTKTQQRIGVYLKSTEDIAEEDESQVSAANDLEKARMQSCITKIKSTIQTNISEEELGGLVHKFGFDVEKVIDNILTQKCDNVKKETQAPAVNTSSTSGSVKVISASGSRTPVTKGFQVQQPPKTESENSEQQSNKASQQRSTGEPLKPHLYLVVLGHVDAGKSTLLGHLLHTLQPHLHSTPRSKTNKKQFSFAWILDETPEERTRGITMDLGHATFETESKTITILDAPGHKDFIPHAISGTSQSDAALLLVDATVGEFETGFEQGGQTREHATIIRSLGITQICVVINKLDTVGYSLDRYTSIREKCVQFLRQVGFRDADVSFVPTSGLTGENLTVKPTNDVLGQWYDGPCLLEVIDAFKPPDRPTAKPFRFTVDDVYKGTGSNLCIAGRVQTGTTHQGDKVIICPNRESSSIKSITIDDAPVKTAYAGDQAVITFVSGSTLNIFPGCVVCHVGNTVDVCRIFEVRVVVLAKGLTKGQNVELHVNSAVESATVKKLIAKLDKTSLEKVGKPRLLAAGAIGIVQVCTQRAIALQVYSECKQLGRVTLRAGGVTVAAGMVTKILE